MPKYGQFFYGVGLYGGDPEFLFDARPVEAGPVGYGGLIVTWRTPTGDWDALRLVRSSSGRPTTVDEGVIVVDAGLDAQTTYIDNGLEEGRFYYYTVFVRRTADDQWVAAGGCEGLVTKNHTSGLNLFNQLPAIYQQKDSDTNTGTDGAGQLERFLRIFGMQFDILRTEIDSLSNLSDSRRIAGSLLSAMADDWGMPYEAELGETLARKQVENAAYLYKMKGTVIGVQGLVSSLTGWESFVYAGTNLMLDQNDATAAQSLGRWGPTVNCTVTRRNRNTPPIFNKAVPSPGGANNGNQGSGDWMFQQASVAAGSMTMELATSTVLGSVAAVKSYGVPVKESYSYVFSGYVIPEVTTTLRNATVTIHWHDINGTVITVATGDPSMESAAGYVRPNVSQTAPPGATWASFSATIAGATTANEKHNWVSFSMEEGLAPTPWEPARDIRIELTDRINLVPNPNFFLNTAFWFEGNTTVTLTRTTTAGQFFVAPAAGKLHANTAGDLDVYTQFAVEPLEELTLSAYLMPAVGTANRNTQIEVFFVDGGGNVVGIVNSPVTAEVMGQFVRPSVTTKVPIGSVQASMHVLVLGAALGEDHYLDAAMGEPAGMLRPYFDGSIFSSEAEYLWAGLPSNSSSYYYSRRQTKNNRLNVRLPEYLAAGSTYTLIYAGIGTAPDAIGVPTPVITNSSLPNAEVGRPYTAALTATGGTTPYVWDIPTGSLPNGLTLNASTGQITGTPLDAFNPTFVVRVTDANAQTNTTAGLSITVQPPPDIIDDFPDATTGVAYSHISNVIGGYTAYIWSITSGSLPTGMSLNTSTGEVAGTPTVTGTSTFSLHVLDSFGGADTASIAIDVASGSGSGGTPLVIPGNSINPYIRLAGDQVVIVPNGRYTAGQISDASHPTTTGPYKGYIVLVAESPGGVIVDMSPVGEDIGGGLTSNGDLLLDQNTSNVLMIGFKFVNGTLRLKGVNLYGWYCEATFPATTWAAEPGHTNTTGSFYHQGHDAPRAVIYDSSGGSTNSGNGVGMYGCDIHDTGTTVYCIAGVNNCFTVGSHLYNGTDHAPNSGTVAAWAASTAYSRGDVRRPTADNGRIYVCTKNGTSGSSQPSWPTTTGNTVLDGSTKWCDVGVYGNDLDIALDNVHPDGIAQVNGSVTGHTVSYCEIDHILTLAINTETPSGSCSGQNWSHLWAHDCTGSGLMMYASPTHNIVGSLLDVHSWNNGANSTQRADNGYQHVKNIDGVDVTYDINDNRAPRIDMLASGSDTLVDASAGGTVTPPWQVWRTAHPYASWASFFGFSGSSGTSNPDLGRDLRVWMQQPTGPGTYAPTGVLLLPPGTYYAGPLGTILGTGYCHAYNPALPLNGWLVLKAQTPGTVTINLAIDAAGATVSDMTKGGGLGHNDYYEGDGYGSYRTIFDGIDFVNGTVSMTGGDRLRFWYTTHTFSPTEWKRQFDMVCTYLGIPTTSTIPNNSTYRAVFDDSHMKRNNTPAGLRLQTIVSTRPWDGSTVPHGGTPASRVLAGGIDIKYTTDDGIFLGSTVSHKFWGIKTWGLGLPYVGDGPAAWIHTDSCQWIGAESAVEFYDSMLLGHIELVAEAPGSITGVVMSGSNGGMWVGSLPGMQSLDNDPGRNISGTIGSSTNADADLYFFADGWGQSSTNGPSGGYSGSDMEYSNINCFYPLYNTKGLSISVHTTRLDIVTMGWTSANSHNTKLADEMEVVNDSRNPANRWRAAHPQSTRDTFWAGTYD